MLPYHGIDPVIFSIGPISVRWYGVMYALSFIIAYLYVSRDIKRNSPRVEEDLRFFDNLIVYVILGVIIGGRLGYVVFYNPTYYIDSPLSIIKIWEGGMSFHGGAIGACVSGYVYCRFKGQDFWEWIDRCVVPAPIGLGLGRIGNFINGELYGRPSTLPWAMMFPDGGPVYRHPSQIYEAILEGPVLFLVLWYQKGKVRCRGELFSYFLMYYSLFRFIAEFFREPDPQIGYILKYFTMGQVLSVVFFVCGVVLLKWRREMGCGGLEPPTN